MPAARRRQRRLQRLPHRAPVHAVAVRQATDGDALIAAVPSDMLKQLHLRHSWSFAAGDSRSPERSHWIGRRWGHFRSSFRPQVGPLQAVTPMGPRLAVGHRLAPRGAVDQCHDLGGGRGDHRTHSVTPRAATAAREPIGAGIIGSRSPQSSVPASGVTEVDVGDHRAILHTGVSHVKEDYGGQGERELVGVAPQAGGRG